VVKEVSAGWGTCFRAVSLDDCSDAFTYWKDTIAVGLNSGCIIILNTITGTQMTTLSGHTDIVKSLAFSPDGTLLVSGSSDKVVKLWDMQTGGVVKTFQGHDYAVYSVYISADHTTIASGSRDRTIHLWDVLTGECSHIIKQKESVNYVCFSPLDPKHFVSVSGGQIWQWDTSCQQITPEYSGTSLAFSLDGTQFVVCKQSGVEVQNSGSKEIVAKFHVTNERIEHCCFSPDNRIVVLAAGDTIYVWEITSSDPHLLQTIISHTVEIGSLKFSSPSFLISISENLVKFWQIGTSPINPALNDPKHISLASAPIESITLQAKDGIAISSHLDGMVRIWDIPTGLCRISFRTPAKDYYCINTCLIDGRLISVWCTGEKLYIWDTEKGELRTLQEPEEDIMDLRISGDGSTVFGLCWTSICAWSIQTGEIVGVVMEIMPPPDAPLVIDGLKVWSQSSLSGKVMGWDFGTLGSSPAELSNTSRNGPHLDFIGGIRPERQLIPGVQDTATGKVVFKLPERLANCSDAQWDGQYLVVGYDSGEVLILECNYVPC